MQNHIYLNWTVIVKRINNEYSAKRKIISRQHSFYACVNSLKCTLHCQYRRLWNRDKELIPSSNSIDTFHVTTLSSIRPSTKGHYTTLSMSVEHLKRISHFPTRIKWKIMFRVRITKYKMNHLFRICIDASDKILKSYHEFNSKWNLLKENFFKWSNE